MPKETFYFSHDYNARTDSKIKKLLVTHQYAGYGLYWAIIEDLYNNANALPTDYKGIAYDLRTDEETVKSIINDFDLFILNGETFSSHSVKKRLDARNEKSVKARESANKGWEKRKPDANALRLGCERNAIKESKVKESSTPRQKVIECLRRAAPVSISIDQIEREADELLKFYAGKKIGNLPALCNSWMENVQQAVVIPVVKKEIPKTIDYDNYMKQ